MKKIGRILSLAVVMVMLAASTTFASGLTLESIYPEDGDNTLQFNNVAVKLMFSENMTSEEAQAANEDCFTITNEKGKAIKYKALYNAEKYPNEIWLQLTSTLTENTEYTLKISGDIVSSAGNSLDDGQTIKFSTRDTKQDNNIYMIMMVLMVVGMVGFTAWDTRHKIKKEMAENIDEDKVNPYKEAKKTGKSVEEIIAKTEQEKAKAEKQKAKAAKKLEAADEEESTEAPQEENGNKRVKAKRSVIAAGFTVPSTIVAQNKAKAEARVKAAEQAKKHSVTKSKGSKQQQRKKNK